MTNKNKLQQSPKPVENLIKANEVASVLFPNGGRGRQTILRWARERRIPCVRLGYRTMLFDIEQVRAALGKFSVEEVSK